MEGETRMDAYWTPDNTAGYTPEEVDALNRELAERLAGIEPHTDVWHETITAFADEVARR